MWRTCLKSDSVSEEILRTTQGNLGLKGDAHDHSTGGCTVIALLIASACLANIASSFVVEKIIDNFCQTPLRNIRKKFYREEDFNHVTSEEAVDELCLLNLLPRPDVSAPSPQP